MSQRKNAPYADKLDEDGKVLFYIGHDAYGHPAKTTIDQPLATEKGTLTQNGHFFLAVEKFKQHGTVERVRVYEKLKEGIWVYNGLFQLIDASMLFSQGRKLCQFTLKLIEQDEDKGVLEEGIEVSPGRLIPTSVKIDVYKRDKGQCVICGSKIDLHFDHILPYSKGGSSTNPDNIQLLCQRHNLEKHDKLV